MKHETKSFIAAALILLGLIAFGLFGCKTTKINKDGDRVLTANQKHFNITNPYGKKYGKGFLPPITLKSLNAKDN